MSAFASNLALMIFQDPTNRHTQRTMKAMLAPDRVERKQLVSDVITALARIPLENIKDGDKLTTAGRELQSALATSDLKTFKVMDMIHAIWDQDETAYQSDLSAMSAQL